MERKDFLKITGLGGGVSLIPFGKVLAEENKASSCVLIPTETIGPFPLT